MKYRKPKDSDSDYSDSDPSMMPPQNSTPFYRQSWFLPILLLMTILLWLQFTPSNKLVHVLLRMDPFYVISCWSTFCNCHCNCCLTPVGNWMRWLLVLSIVHWCLLVISGKDKSPKHSDFLSLSPAELKDIISSEIRSHLISKSVELPKQGERTSCNYSIFSLNYISIYLHRGWFTDRLIPRRV